VTLYHASWLPWRGVWQLKFTADGKEDGQVYMARNNPYWGCEVVEDNNCVGGFALWIWTPLFMVGMLFRARLWNRFALGTGLVLGLLPKNTNLLFVEGALLYVHQREWLQVEYGLPRPRKYYV